MVIRDTVLLGDPRLREISEPVVFDRKLPQILEDLKDTLTEHQRVYKMGRGLAAPQIGYSKRLVYIQTPKFTGYLINPEIVWRSPETFEVWDSCFSIEAKFFVKITRNKSIKVKYTDQSQEFHNETFNNDMSELLQHEIDHLDGIMCSDRLTDLKNIVMRQEWEKRYRTKGVGM
jgi:peptide deformylase